MSQWGVIWTGYRCRDFLPDSISGWLAARRKLGLKICVVSCPFNDFLNGPEDGTNVYLHHLLDTGEIDALFDSETPKTEVEARGEALRWLVKQGCETLWQADADEIYQLEQIERTIAFVEARPHVAWFRSSLKNRVFDRHTYLTEPFQPPRIHRVRVGGYQAAGFWDDNNISYHGTITRDIKRDLDFPSMTIPKTVAWVDHVTWLSDLRSQRKQAYQWKRWGRCSFKWDDVRGLVWNPDFPIPETAQD